MQGEVMEVVEGQGQQRVEGYLDKLAEPQRVKGVAIDMHEPFHQTTQMSPPQAKIVADRFHLIRRINSTPDKVRSKLQEGNRKGKRRNLFKSKYALLKRAKSLADWERARLNQLFYRYPESKRAWVLKESFSAWYRETGKSRAEEKLRLLERKIASDSLYEFKELLHTFANWRGDTERF